MSHPVPPVRPVPPVHGATAPTRFPPTTVDPERLRTTWSRWVTATQAVQASLAAALDRHGVTVHEVAALGHLSRLWTHRATLTELARGTGLTPAGLTRCVDRLETHGWVVRESAAGDRRVVLAVLTGEGLAAGQRFERLAHEHLAEQFGARLGAEGLATLNRLLDLLAGPEDAPPAT